MYFYLLLNMTLYYFLLFSYFVNYVMIPGNSMKAFCRKMIDDVLRLVHAGDRGDARVPSARVELVDRPVLPRHLRLR